MLGHLEPIGLEERNLVSGWLVAGQSVSYLVVGSCATEMGACQDR